MSTMLKHEDAVKRLEQYQIKNWQEKMGRALGKLPGQLANTGRALLGRDAAGKPFKNWQKRNKAMELAQERLAAMAARDRQKLFQVLFPKLGGYLEAGWELMGSLPYEIGYTRRGFRAPNDRSIGNRARLSWLNDVIQELGGYDQDVKWFAAWAPYLSYGRGADSVGILLAAAINKGGPTGEEVFEILLDSARNEHEIGRMGRHVTRALLVANRPAGWEFMEKLLLAAQRQEGLRQVILESIDEAHPEAFRRMVRMILDQNLIRFSSVVRAVDVWFGLGFDSLTPGKIKAVVEEVHKYLDDARVRDDALKHATGESLYLALWTLGFEDANAAVKPAARLLKDREVERRYVAVRFLSQLELPAAQRELIPCLDDEDLRIALHALNAVPADGEVDLFDRLKRLLDRMPARQTQQEALVWPWTSIFANRENVADRMVQHIGNRPLTVLLPYLSSMGYSGRYWLLNKIIEQKKWEGPIRDTLFALAGDKQSYIRERALDALKKCQVSEQEAVRMEGFLTRKNSEVRRGVLGLLIKQKSDAAVASADRLLGSKNANQRLAGLELLRQLVDARRSVAPARQRAREYLEGRRQLSEHEQIQIDAILDIHRVVPVLDDALGLMNPAERTPVVPPRRRKVTLMTPAAVACLESLDALIQANADTTLTLQTHAGPQEELLANVCWGFPSPDWSKDMDEDMQRLPLRELWEEWYLDRPKKLCDRDGLELLRALVWYRVDNDDFKNWQKLAKRSPGLRQVVTEITGGQQPVKLQHQAIIDDVLAWLLRLHPVDGTVDFLLDALETTFALVPEREIKHIPNPKKNEEYWRDFDLFNLWLRELGAEWERTGADWTKQQRARYWQLLHWRDQPVGTAPRDRPALNLLLAGYEAGVANETDVLDELLGPREVSYYGRSFSSLGELTSHKPPEVLQRRPELQELVNRCRSRVLEIELARGELVTAATQPARGLGSLEGLDVLVRLLQALGKKGFDRRMSYGQNKTTVLTYLINRTFPRPTDTPEDFVAQVKPLLRAGLFKPERLLELAFLAPQWLKHIDRYFGWPGFIEGAWWFLAHTPSGRAGVISDGVLDEEDIDFDEEEIEVGERPQKKDPWELVLSERTPLTRTERREGAVDAAWFQRTYEVVGPKHWQQLADAAKFGCTDQGHKKAIVLGDVLRGRARKADLVAGVRRALRESVRLLGLLPLPADPTKRETDLLGRYRELQGYRRYARSLSPMSRESAIRAGEVGLENLARTAGYPDPIRLEWAMEAREIADLAQGPISASAHGVTVTLALDAQAQPELTVKRGEKVLKSIPAEVRKVPKVALLADRKADLKRQASRMRMSLETAMIRGDTFTGAELRTLFEHPILTPMLERLVLLGEGIRGYPVAGGKGLKDFNDKVEPIKADEQLRIAHPHDFLTDEDWSDWQNHCFRVERVQPFKQVFRELYVVTREEKREGSVSHRYAGHQVNPNQAMALLGSRGWATREGVTRTFYDLGLVAQLDFRSGAFTPLEMEGLTLDSLEFRKRHDWKPIPLKDVPPRIFSEVMRDLDLVVSVAHLGGVDPEASQSTIEMRAALLRETCALLKIENYQLKNSHVIIEGELGKYSVHLGSAVVHRQPGGYVCIVPVHAQQRGRLFLPFADDDPRTAEVLSKVILLARDQEIQDPSIIEQLRSR
jgi:HEAT repeat protein